MTFRGRKAIRVPPARRRYPWRRSNDCCRPRRRGVVFCHRPTTPWSALVSTLVSPAGRRAVGPSVRPLARAVAIAVSLSAAACTTAPSPTPPEAALYVKYCAVCHGEDGRAQTGTDSPQLNNPTLLASADDAFLAANTARGRLPTKMTAYGQEYGGPLTAQEIEAIVAHLRSWDSGTEPTPAAFVARGDSSAGAGLYEAQCVTCHGPAGASDVAPDLATATFQSTASDAFISYAIRRGRPGTAMPPFDLTDTQIADLISFIRSLPVVPQRSP
ncbi:MAG: c-type cytochrome [Anaerolineae bacterium]